MSELKTYTIEFDEDRNKGTYAIAVVEDPAMSDFWITLSKAEENEMTFQAIDDEKKILLGAAIIPNKRIYRNIGGNEFYVVFKEDVIEKIAHNYIKQGYVNNSSENHEKVIQGTTVVQSWVVEDPIKDKSNIYGKQYEKGTWVVMMKVDNPDIWQKAKDKKLTGFSIEAGLGLKEMKLKNQEMEENSILKAIKDGFASITKKEEKILFGEVKLQDQKTTLMFEGDTPQVGKAIFVKPAEKDGEKTLAPEGAYDLEGGGKLYVDKDGAIMEAPKGEEISEEVKEEMVAEMKKQVEALTEGLQKEFDAKLKLATDEVAKLKKENEELEAKLAKEPENDKPIIKLQEIAEPKNKKQRLLNAVIKAAQNAN